VVVVVVDVDCRLKLSEGLTCFALLHFAIPLPFVGLLLKPNEPGGSILALPQRANE